MPKSIYILILLILSISNGIAQNVKSNFSYLDVFDLEYVSDPQVSPDGTWVIYKRNGFDIMKDTKKGELWMIKTDGSGHQKLTSREVNESSASWSPFGDKIAFISSTDEGSEIYIYWVNSGKTAKISQLPFSPSSLIWSPKGDELAFSMHVPSPPPVAAKIPEKPKGAKWAESPRITDRLKHEADGKGYIKPGYQHIFVMPAEGGAARQITSGNFNHGGALSWSPDGNKIYFSGNRIENWEYDFNNSEIYSIDIQTGVINTLTSRVGPDESPKISPDGKYIAYIGYTDKVQAHQTSYLNLMKSDGSESYVLSKNLDRSVSNIIWDSKSKGLYFSYDDQGNTKIAYINLSGKIDKLADDLGGTSIGRPYAGGSFTVSHNGVIAYTFSKPDFPAELAVKNSKSIQKITNLNDGLLNYRTLGKTEEIWYKSSVDNIDIQGWIVYPPNYTASKKYPLLVENHGGPILNYGDRFSAELQLYAAAGYVVFYPNPRGSTSYGEAFANLLYHNYPGEDYNDVMDGVDTLIQKGIAHEDQLFVTGGSAGGIMTAWIIGKNNRFEAAVVAKPVINWISKTLVADNYFGYANTRYPGQPWENFETYWKFSPLSLVGNIETPTMVMVGMNDLRTPPSEAKQLYHALKLRKIESVLVEIPGAGHGIAARPSNLISKVANTLSWFEKYRKEQASE
ncbi:MAG: S9 family peptidase [Flavobacteriaceae bacterium]|nr:S9 family peptidase [Flavobacteriaceae bacterium]